MATPTYEDFILRVEPDYGQTDRVHVLQSPAGQASGPLALPALPPMLATWRAHYREQLYLARSARQPATSIFRHLRPFETSQPPAQALVSVGETLFTALFSEPVYACFEASRTAAARRGHSLRIHLRLGDARLASLPWEALYDSQREQFLGLSRHTPLIRYLELTQEITPLSVAGSIRILAMSVRPHGAAPLNVEAERRHMEDAFATPNHLARLWPRRVQITWVQGQTIDDLADQIQIGGPYHVFHFIGHGQFDADEREGRLLFATASGQPDPRPISHVAHLLAELPSLRLVVLNACEGASGATDEIFSSMAGALVQAGLPAVVAMQQAITDRAAITFARAFYRAVGRRLPVDTACAEARKAMWLADPRSVEWVTPVLHMRSPDGQLFAPRAPIPWLRIGAPLGVMLLLAALVIWWLFVRLPIPQGTLNIAVAPFHQIGDVTDGGKPATILSTQLATFLEATYISSAAGEVDVVTRNIGVVRDAQSAQTLIERFDHRVQLVIYGKVDVVGDQARLTPSFFIAAPYRNDVGELNGPHELAAPLLFSVGDILSPTAVDAALQQRARLIVDFTQGLVHSLQDQLPEAAAALGRAIQAAETYGDFAGKEVIYLFASDVARRQGSLAEAEQYASRALAVNPNYGRGYIARGNAYYFQGNDFLGQALGDYEAALRLPNQPALSFVAEKAHLGLGHVYFRRYLIAKEVDSPRAPAYVEEATRHYEAVIASIGQLARPSQQNREQQALAHLGLGELAIVLGEEGTALCHLCAVLELSVDEGLRQIALDDLHKLGATCPSS